MTADIPTPAAAEPEFSAGDRVFWYHPPYLEGTILKNNGGMCKVQWDTGEVRRDAPEKLRLVAAQPAPDDENWSFVKRKKSEKSFGLAAPGATPAPRQDDVKAANSYQGMPIYTDDPGYHCPRCGLDDSGIKQALAWIGQEPTPPSRQDDDTPAQPVSAAGSEPVAQEAIIDEDNHRI